VRCQCDLDNSGILRSLNWYFVTVVSTQPLGPDLKGKTIQEELLLDGLILEERTFRLSRNVGDKINIYTAGDIRRCEDVKIRLI